MYFFPSKYSNLNLQSARDNTLRCSLIYTMSATDKMTLIEKNNTTIKILITVKYK